MTRERTEPMAASNITSKDSTIIVQLATTCGR